MLAQKLKHEKEKKPEKQHSKRIGRSLKIKLFCRRNRRLTDCTVRLVACRPAKCYHGYHINPQGGQI